MNSKQLALTFRLLGRDWRGGELGLLLAALVVAVTIVVAIALFVDRIQGAILGESNQFLAADRLIRSNVAIPTHWADIAQSNDLRHAEVLNFPTMAMAGDQLRLVAVKAASNEYPLLGQVTFLSAPGGRDQLVSGGPAAGEVWVSPRLLPLLEVDIGEPLMIGEVELTITGLVVREPDAGFSAFAYGPRVLMNLDDIAQSGVVQPGSRVQHNLLVSGSADALSSWEAAMREQLRPDDQLMGVKEAQPRLAQSIDRAERFLLLAGAMGVVLAGVAIAIASRRYTERHYDYVGVLKSLGATSNKILSLYLSHLIILCFIAVFTGSILGWFLHWVAVDSVRGLLLVDLPEPGYAALVLGAATAGISFLAFACPALLHLQKVAPMRVLRRELGTPDFNSRLVLWVGMGGLLALIYLYSSSLVITVSLLLVIGLLGALVMGLTWCLIRIAPGLDGRAANAWALALAAIRRRSRHSALQVFVFTVVILLVLVLALLRNALLEEWRLQIPPETPNHFVLNISPYEVDGFVDLLQQHGYEHAGIYPTARVRMSAHNGQPLRRQDGPASQEGAAAPSDQAGRSINITWSEQLPEDNLLIDGQWWDDAEPGGVSLEEEFATRYGIKIGDRLRFSLADASVELQVRNIRQLDWERMRPNFFVIASPGSLEAFDLVSMTSFYLPPGNKAFLNTLLRELPTVSIIEMDRVIEQVTRIIDQVSMAVELVLLLIALAAAIVLLASIQTSMDERFRDNAILKTLGARLGLLRQAMRLEFAFLGAMAGLLAAGGAELVAALLQTRILDMQPQFHPWLFLVGPAMGAVIVTLIGLAVARRSLSATPMTVLRQLSS